VLEVENLVGYPALRLAGYPAESVSGAALIISQVAFTSSQNGTGSVSADKYKISRKKPVFRIRIGFMQIRIQHLLNADPDPDPVEFLTAANFWFN
jgi:hypothetical protein